MQNENCKESNITYTMAFWLLRIWLATRAIGTGLVKFQGVKQVVKPEFAGEDADVLAVMPEAYEKVNGLGFQFYHALPEKGPMSIEGFMASPLMPNFAVQPYAMVLGYALVGLGLALLLGVCTRVTLFLMGLLYVSLTYGFIILEPTLRDASAAGIAFLGVHMIMIVAALLLANYNKFELLPCGKLPFCKCNK